MAPDWRMLESVLNVFFRRNDGYEQDSVNCSAAERQIGKAFPETTRWIDRQSRFNSMTDENCGELRR